MLAAECTWVILRAEHARIRELLALVESALGAADGTGAGPRAAKVVERIERLQAFDESTHRPKGAVLLKVMRGRSAEADRLLARLELRCRRCDSLLMRAKALLAAGRSGDMRAAEEAEDLLRVHRKLMRAQLDQEDTLLHSHTAELLRGDEWAAVASSVSTATVQAAAPGRRTRGTQHANGSDIHRR
ncbi:hemerythrin domain-containing protein [Variovorax paradoxus]|nr:hemerythrin domain-containing protein [Variovorax paradoxus]